MNKYHKEILELIIANSGQPTQHTFLDNYLGNTNPRYPINIPTLRTIAKGWMREHDALTAKEFSKVLDGLVKGKSSTEKTMVGIMLGYATPDQRKFDIKIFESWLDQVKGWAEIDSLCTGSFLETEILPNWSVWKPLLLKLVKDKNITKRRASIVLLCSPLRKSKDERLAEIALKNIEKLKGEKEVLITKAISWVLRTMIKHHSKVVSDYLTEHRESLPKIAVRETLVKLKTGTKNKRK